MAKTISKTNRIYLPDIVGGGYKTFWNSKQRYRVIKGSRASKKSKTAALWIVYNMMKPQYSQANTLIVRKTFRTLKDSCFSDIQWAIHRLSVDHLWSVKTSPLEITYNPTGQKILFRGLDDPLKIASISVERGSICWGWIEEAYEITKESDFDMLDESIRGHLDPPLFKSWIITFNPWNEHHWLKKKFFDSHDPNILAITTNYKCNEWLDDEDLNLFDRMKQTNPRRYEVAGLGNWGAVEGVVFERWREQPFLLTDLPPTAETISGLDFGFTNDPTAFVTGAIDIPSHKIYIWDEIYKKQLTNRAIYEEIKEAGYSKNRITADSAEPKSIRELRDMGLRIRPAEKGKDSIRHGIQFIENFEIIVHPRCTNFITEISNYTYQTDKQGNTTNTPIDDFNHLMDALRYAAESYTKKQGVNTKDYLGTLNI